MQGILTEGEKYTSPPITYQFGLAAYHTETMFLFFTKQPIVERLAFCLKGRCTLEQESAAPIYVHTNC